MWRVHQQEGETYSWLKSSHGCGEPRLHAFVCKRYGISFCSHCGLQRGGCCGCHLPLPQSHVHTEQPPRMIHILTCKNALKMRIFEGVIQQQSYGGRVDSKTSSWWSKTRRTKTKMSTQENKFPHCAKSPCQQRKIEAMGVAQCSHDYDSSSCFSSSYYYDCYY